MLDSKAVRTKIFADGADLDVISRFARDPRIKGFTTTPTLMRKAGGAAYAGLVRDFLRLIPARPISFEVFSDDFNAMLAQATVIASWERMVYVKIPVTS